jgi:hypothetical protein
MFTLHSKEGRFTAVQNLGKIIIVGTGVLESRWDDYSPLNEW